MTEIAFAEIETTGDPLGDLGLDLTAEVDAIHERDEAAFEDVETVREVTDELRNRIERAKQTIEDWLRNPRTGEPLYLDFETIPDFERLHLFDLEPIPEMPPTDAVDALLSADELVSQTVPEIEAWLAKHNPPEEWIAKAEAAEKAAKKPRKGVFDAIDAHKKRINGIASAEADRIKLLSVRPFYCSICCVSLGVGSEEPISLYASNRDEERQLIELTWQVIKRYTPIIGFGVGFFDIPVLLTRSMILGVKPERFLDRRKYGSKDILDLCQELFPDGRSTMGLKPLCRSLGIDIAAEGVDGSSVYELWKAGKADEICRYCESDVDLVQVLHLDHMAGYFVA